MSAAAQPVMIRLTAERGHQLKQFAAREGLSITAAIGAMLRAVKATDTIPGFSIELVDADFETYRLSFDGFDIMLSSERWKEFADEIDRVATQAGTGARKLNLPLGEEIILARGGGTTFLIKAHDPLTGKTVNKGLSHDLALDLAQMIRSAVEHV